MELDKILGDVKEQIKKYRIASSESSMEKMQDNRDELSILLLSFNEGVVASLRGKAEATENEYKFRVRKSIVENRNDTGKGKTYTSAAVADKEAENEHREYQKDVEKAQSDYYKARGIKEGIEQVLNTISSRLKMLSKYE